MTSNHRFRERNRDIQDGTERHVWGEQEFVDGAGSVVRVRGTGTQDEEAPVIVGVVSFNLPKDTNAEVFLLSNGSDTNQKFAVITIPRDKQRQWKEGNGGVQHPTDPDFAVEFNGKRCHVTKGKFAVGETGILEIVDGQAYFRGNVTIDGTLTVNGGVVTPVVTQGTAPVPGFDP